MSSWTQTWWRIRGPYPPPQGQRKHYISLAINYMGETHPIVVAIINRSATSNMNFQTEIRRCIQISSQFCKLNQKTQQNQDVNLVPQNLKTMFRQPIFSVIIGSSFLLVLQATLSWGSWNLFGFVSRLYQSNNWAINNHQPTNNQHPSTNQQPSTINQHNPQYEEDKLNRPSNTAMPGR